jgi:uncharacterized protein DUF4382
MRPSKYMMLTLAAGLAGCEAGAGPQMSHLFVRLTDAPAPALASAQVWISTVYLVGGDGTSRFTITSGPSTEYDLLNLQGGVTALLGDLTIPAGDYAQLRLIVDSARVTLAGGVLFSDGTDSRDLKVPSGPQTGIKVEFGGPVHIAPGQTSLVVDFDVARSFVFLGPSDSPNGVLFKPVLHGTVSDQAGSISGTSSPAAALGMLFAINGADTVASAAADPVTGAYALQFLPPGSYTVADSSTATGHVAPSQTVTVGVAQHVSGVDFTLP